MSTTASSKAKLIITAVAGLAGVAGIAWYLLRGDAMPSAANFAESYDVMTDAELIERRNRAWSWIETNRNGGIPDTDPNLAKQIQLLDHMDQILTGRGLDVAQIQKQAEAESELADAVDPATAR
jgi:hypothetical protein